MAKVGFVGVGNMASALIKGIIDKNVLGFADIFVTDIDGGKVKQMRNTLGVGYANSNAELAEKVDMLFLCVKPQVMDKVLAEIKDAVNEKMVIVSIAAGVTVEKITSFLGDKAVIRVMPNTPALIGEGMSGIYANKKAQGCVDKVKKILKAVGKVVVVDDEELIDAITAVSGSGPAYFFLLMEKMTEAGSQLGLDPDIAKKLVMQTAKGAIGLVEYTSERPAVLRQKVTSPGGTTEAALKTMKEGALDETIIAAIKRAAQRSKELSG